MIITFLNFQIVKWQEYQAELLEFKRIELGSWILSTYWIPYRKQADKN